MFSFMKIATLATLAFGTLASALPSPVAAPAPVSEGELVARTDTVYSVLTGLNSDLQAPVAQLNALSPADCTPDKVQPIVLNIQVLISVAVDKCKGLSAGGDILLQLSIILNLVFGAAGKVYGYPGVDKAGLQIVFQLLDLISLVFGLVGGLLGLLAKLLVGLLTVVPIILELGLTSVIHVLGL
ncbi:hypothetical protein K488DRAFT_71854 [Vararia minispora EC-137]|uniref:Uncharacterized protein n=1 Tax=Vararia minispora EC-137 TaxID=1314806 RepID=A0ACB8QG99_9AGAM|nr:hypothetical protein K488DRAFT_71854 [Vararia minispora EC-137]